MRIAPAASLLSVGTECRKVTITSTGGHLCGSRGEFQAVQAAEPAEAVYRLAIHADAARINQFELDPVLPGVEATKDFRLVAVLSAGAGASEVVLPDVVAEALPPTPEDTGAGGVLPEDLPGCARVGVCAELSGAGAFVEVCAPAIPNEHKTIAVAKLKGRIANS